MFVMVGGRRSGKTVASVRWLLEHPGERVMVVANEDHKRHFLRTLYQIAGEEIFQFCKDNVMTAHEAARGLRGRASEIGVDDAERVFQYMLSAPLGFVAMNGTLLPTAYSGPPRDYMDGEYEEVPQTRIEGRRQIEYRPDASHPSPRPRG